MSRAAAFSCLLLSLVARQADGQSPRLSSQQRRAIDSLMIGYRTAQRMPALSVAIGQDGEMLFASAQGLADIENAVPATPLTKFRAASTQKALTATAVLRLVQAGRIGLDAEIHQYCPRYPAQRWPVTIRQLLLHQGGVRASDRPDVFSRDHYASVTEALSRFGGDSLRFVPGSSALYSNYGYVLLACAIEGASRQSYDDYLRNAVFVPAGMTSTTPVNLYRAEPHRAMSYVIRTAENTRSLQGLWTTAHLASSPLEEPFPADLVDPSYEPGAGNYWSVPTDMVRFAMTLDAGNLVSDSLRRLEYRPQPAPPGATPRPMGWTIGNYGSLETAQVFGSDWNGSFALVSVPSRHLAIAIASNINWDVPTSLVQSLLKVLIP